MSSIMGTLSANGQVYLLNPNGVLIGEGEGLSVLVSLHHHLMYWIVISCAG